MVGVAKKGEPLRRLRLTFSSDPTMIVYGPMSQHGYFKGTFVPSPPEDALRYPYKEREKEKQRSRRRRKKKSKSRGKRRCKRGQ